MFPNIYPQPNTHVTNLVQTEPCCTCCIYTYTNEWTLPFRTVWSLEEYWAGNPGPHLIQQFPLINILPWWGITVIAGELTLLPYELKPMVSVTFRSACSALPLHQHIQQHHDAKNSLCFASSSPFPPQTLATTHLFFFFLLLSLAFSRISCSWSHLGSGLSRRAAFTVSFSMYFQRNPIFLSFWFLVSF